MADKASNGYPDVPNLSDLMPDTDIGDVLEEVEGVPLVIERVAFEPRNGLNGAYTMTVLYCQDGAVYHTGSPIIAERIGAYDTGVGRYPVRMTFTREASKRNPRNKYWTVK